MKTDISGKIFKVKRFSLHDGPGIRTSVFLKGCPLNCVWCHSPEGISREISIWHDKSLCIACGICVKSCRFNALELKANNDSGINIDRNLCQLSGNCTTNCPTGAISFTGSEATVSEIMNEIEKDLLYYTTSGGGVTLTGGEPLLQPEFSSGILRECRRMKIHTAIETSLYAEKTTIDRISEFVDLYLIDMKIYDTIQHIRFTGKSNEIIRENFRSISHKGIRIIVRVPLVKNITDTIQNLNSIRSFINEVDERIPIELIPFNSLAENNYKKLGIPFLFE